MIDNDCFALISHVCSACDVKLMQIVNNEHNKDTEGTKERIQKDKSMMTQQGKQQKSDLDSMFIPKIVNFEI